MNGPRMISPLDRLDELGLRPLPDEAMTVLARFDTPPVLLAHLILVHDTAAQLVEFLAQTWPDLNFDRRAVVLGAAWHDIGKVAHPAELSEHGSAHEAEGARLLVEAGISPELARFARTHGRNAAEPDIALEDLLVALADTAWKDRRSEALEGRITAIIAAALDSPEWEVFIALDDAIERISAPGARRLAWQAQFADSIPKRARKKDAES